MVETKCVPIPAITGPLDLSRPHFVGIGGAGMSALALLLAARGAKVTGCDLRSDATDRLRTAGAAIHLGHDVAHLGGPSVVVWSSSLGVENVEVAAARRAGIPVVHRSQLLAQLVDGAEDSVVVAGTHGKSTTTGMLVCALGSHVAGWAGGAELLNSGMNAGWGSGNVFVAEGDESDRSLRHYRPGVAVVLNAEDDHPETYVDRGEVVAVLADFARTARVLVTCADDEGAREVAALVRGQVPVMTFGRAPEADVRVTAIRSTDSGGSTVRLRDLDGLEVVLHLTVPGQDAAMDAAAAFTAGLALGVEPDTLITGLAAFAGIARRMTVVGTFGGVAVRDSFAHHPRAILGDISTARQLAGGGRTIVVYEPSGWTRTAALGDAIGAALAGADEVVLLPVHSLIPSPVGAVGTDTVAAAIAANGTRVHQVPDVTEAARVSAALARSGDIVLAMGTRPPARCLSGANAQCRPRGAAPWSPGRHCGTP